MSFFSRRKQQQPAAPPPANVAVAQTPSQALAQLSNSNRDYVPQSGSLRGDSPLTQYVEIYHQLIPSFFKASSDLRAVLYPYLNNHSSSSSRHPYDLKAEITPQILVCRLPILSNLSNNSSSNNSHLVTNRLFLGPLVDLHSFLQTCLVNLVSLPPLHSPPLPSLDTAMLYQQMPVLMGNSIFSVV